MQTINKCDAYNLVKSIMLGNPDKTPEASYVVTEFGATSIGKKPECVVGVILDNLGGRPQDIPGYESWRTERSREDAGQSSADSIMEAAGLSDSVRLTKGAEHIFAMAQAVQDNDGMRIASECSLPDYHHMVNRMGLPQSPTWGQAWKFLTTTVPAFKR